MKKEKPKKKIKKKIKVPVKRTKSNLILFNQKLEIVELINQSNTYHDEVIYRDELYYLEVNTSTFFTLQEKLEVATIKFKTIPNAENIIEQCIITMLPPPPPTVQEITSKALLEQTMQVCELKQQNIAVSKALMEQTISNAHLNTKITTLSKALLEISLKGGK